MLTTQAYSELLATLYAAAVDEAQWQRFLVQLCEAVRSPAAFLMTNDSALGIRGIASAGPATSISLDEAYKASYIYRDPYRQAFMRHPRVGLVEGDEILPHDEFVATGAYRLFAEPSGAEYVTCLVLAVSTRSHQVITVWRGADRPVLEPEFKELLTLLFPHLQNALSIRRAIGHAEQRALNAEAILDASTTASILLDGDARIVHMNHPAQQHALDEDGFRVDIDRVVPTERSKKAEFRALITACAAAGLGHPGGALALGRLPGKRPLQILITPIRIENKHHSSVRVLVLATDPDRPAAFPDEVLRALYGLTPAETEVANALMTGFTLEEASRLRNVSVATIRSQLKALMAKTGTKRQVELIRLLSTLPRTVPVRNK